MAMTAYLPRVFSSTSSLHTPAPTGRTNAASYRSIRRDRGTQLDRSRDMPKILAQQTEPYAMKPGRRNVGATPRPADTGHALLE
jgi:hypothetical protein